MNAVAALPIIAAAPASSPVLAAELPRSADPIFAAIENHRLRYAEMQAVFSKHKQAHAVAKGKVGPYGIEVPSKVDPGKVVQAVCWFDVERAIPRRKHPKLHAKYLRLLEQQQARYAAVIEPLIGDEDEETDDVAAPELQAVREFADTAPTTLRGLLAMIAYAAEIRKGEQDALDDTPIFERMAAAASRLAAGRS